MFKSCRYLDNDAQISRYYMNLATLHLSFRMLVSLLLFCEVSAEGPVDGAPDELTKRSPGGLPGGSPGGAVTISPQDPQPSEELRKLRFPQKQGALGKQRGKAFADVDIDNDRQLTFSEFAGAKRLQNMEPKKQRQLFDFLDYDKDGYLQMRELFPATPKWMKVARREFPRFDTNKDGQLTITEFSELMKLTNENKLKPAELFDRLDQNKNNGIEWSELNAKPRRFSQPDGGFAAHDKNASGGLDYEEYSQMPWVCKWPELRRKKLFERIDVDGDGELSKHEVRDVHSYRRRTPGFEGSGSKKLPGKKKAF